MSKLPHRRLLQALGGVSLTAAARCVSSPTDSEGDSVDPPDDVKPNEAIPYNTTVDHDISAWGRYDEE